MATSTRDFSPGSLVQARGRNWVVMISDEDDVLRMRPVDGVDEDVIGLYLPLENDSVSLSEYKLPAAKYSGDFTGALLLRDAVRLTLRSGAGPFRSLGRLSVIPRPYQYVPLIMALRLDPVRLLIADDVGVGKTIEAGMIARELLDRGIVKRIGVICAPHLCDQWASELREKFNIETAVIQPSRIARLERERPRIDVSIYQHYRHLVVSIDYIKSERNRRPFLDNAPDLIIVDEAHTAARPRGDRSVKQHQRYDFLRELASAPERHLILTTATPHSGIEESFRSLLGLLDESFDVEDDIELPRRQLVPHLVQRRRSDLMNWLGVDTPFPERESSERTYSMSPEYLKLFEDVLNYCRDSVSTQSGLRQAQQRVRYWAAIAILRCVLSSPAAAEAMLEKRRTKREEQVQSESEDVDEVFASQILDSDDNDQPPDYVPTAPLDDPAAELTEAEIRKLSGFLNTARKIRGPKLDSKLSEVGKIMDELLAEGYSPIVYCRFIATAEYVAEELQKSLERKHRGLRVVSVTGGDGVSEQRREKVDSLGDETFRVLVATDCLSEGINLQEQFNAVVHYDLPWNPNRLEQREGRVDRYGQKRPTVKAVLLYGSDNPIDLVVLEILIRKAKTIRSRLGISVPVPVESEQVIQAIVDSVLLRRQGRAQQLQLALTDPRVSQLHSSMDEAAEQQSKARAYFAQHGINPEEVERELREMEPALGTADDIKEFVSNGLQRFGGSLRKAKANGVFELHPGDTRTQVELRRPDIKFPMKVVFDGIPPEGVILLGRNHPVVTTLSDAILGQALSDGESQFSRSGAIFTDAVKIRTVVVLLRLRYLMAERGSRQFAEEVIVAAFTRGADGLQWIEPYEEEGLRLLKEATVRANISTEERERHVEWALRMLSGNWFDEVVKQRVGVLEESHERLRNVIKSKAITVTPHIPPDVLGCYVLVPSGGGN